MGEVCLADEFILETHGLTKEFAGFFAVRDVSLKVRRGSIHALIGPNGAGKTTCFNLLTKFLQPTAGKILYKGQDITAMAPADVARLGPRPFVPDFGGVSASDRAGERAGGAAAPARLLVRFLALQIGARPLQRPRP